MPEPQHGPRQRGPRQPQREPPAERTFDEIWPGYLLEGYFDGDGNLRPDYVSRKCMEPLVQEMGRADLSMHQVRRFFHHCRAIEARLKARTSTWGAEQTVFAMLDVAAADAFGKKDRKIPALFHDFVRRNVAAVHTETDFLRGFLQHFEALVGFGTKHLKERERN